MQTQRNVVSQYVISPHRIRDSEDGLRQTINAKQSQRTPWVEMQSGREKMHLSHVELKQLRQQTLRSQKT